MAISVDDQVTVHVFSYPLIIPWTLDVSPLLSAVNRADLDVYGPVCCLPVSHGDFADLFVQLLDDMAWISLLLASTWCWLSPLFYHSSRWESGVSL